MPVNYRISEKSLDKRTEILVLCKKPATLNEVSAITGDSTRSLRFNFKKLIKSKHMTVVGTKPSYNNQPAKTYMATGLKYEPWLEAYMPTTISEKGKPTVTVVSCNDYHHTKHKDDKPRRIDARIGSTFSTMAF
jgi:hypothetical protein